MTTSPLGCIELAPTFPPQTYRGISHDRRRRPSERLIDECWLRGDVDATISAVVEHVKTFALRAKYLRKASVDANLPLANRVGMLILRSLPGYSGPQQPLKIFDGRIPLSSFTNLKLKQAHLDLLREHQVVKSHEVLAAELLAPGADEYVVLSLMADRPQVDTQERQLIVDSFMSTLTDRERRRLGSATVLHKAEEWANAERPKVTRRRITRCKCHSCVKSPVTLGVAQRMLDKYGATLSTYALGLRRRPVTPKTVDSDFSYYYPALPE